MDNATLQSLRLAYKQTPDNLPLRMILAKALLAAGEAEEAYELVRALKPAALGEADKLTAARIALARVEGKLALGFLDFETADSLLLRARACLLTHDHESGRAWLKQAVALNPGLEDPELAQALSAKVTEAKMTDAKLGDNVVGFKVISGDAPDKEKDKSKDKKVPAQEGALGAAAASFEPSPSNVTFADIGGLSEVKKIIHRKIILPFQKPSLFEKFKREAGGGVLLYGAPGCGKTLLARATAGECQAKFYNIALADVLDMWLGNSEKRLHALFEQARRTAPAVLFFDELEGMAGKRQYDYSAAAVSRTISQFLTEMDGFNGKNTGVLILGATNLPWSVDPAFRRPGRFDRALFVPPPDREARAAIFKLHLAGRPVEKNVEVETLAAGTSSFSGADIQQVVETACDLAIEETLEKGKDTSVGMKHLKAALAETKPTTAEWLATARNYARYSNEGGQYDEVLEFLKQHGK